MLLAGWATSIKAADEVVYLDTDLFLQSVWNYRTDSTWNYLGSKPCVIDFYATWCGPCKRLAPIMEELAAENCDIIFYKVDVDRERELAYVFQATSIPMLLFVPVKGRPFIAKGLQPKERLQEALKQIR